MSRFLPQRYELQANSIFVYDNNLAILIAKAL